METDVIIMLLSSNYFVSTLWLTDKLIFIFKSKKGDTAFIQEY